MKELFLDIESHILEDEKPSIYLQKLLEEGNLNEYPFTMIRDMKETPQEPKHHPEGNVWNHVMMVLDRAAKYRVLSKDKRVFMWAALLHDIGKFPTTKLRKGRITSYDHDKIGEQMSIDFLKCFTEDKETIYKISKLIRYHMHSLFILNKLPFANISKMVEETSLYELGLLSLCDRLGRGGINKDKEKEVEHNINEFLHIVSETTGDLPIKLSLLT